MSLWESATWSWQQGGNMHTVWKSKSVSMTTDTSVNPSLVWLWLIYVVGCLWRSRYASRGAGYRSSDGQKRRGGRSRCYRWVIFIILFSIFEVAEGNAVTGPLDEVWSLSKRSETDVAVFADLIRKWSDPIISESKVLIRGGARKRSCGERGYYYKRLTRVVNLCSGCQEVILNHLQYKGRCSECGKEVRECG